MNEPTEAVFEPNWDVHCQSCCTFPTIDIYVEGKLVNQTAPSAPVGVVEALSELVDLMQGVIDGEYTPDSFTLQPARAALAQQPAAVDGALRSAAERLVRKAVTQSHTTSSVFTSDVEALERALSAQQGGSDNDR